MILGVDPSMKAIGLALVGYAPRLRDAVLEVEVVRVGARGPVAAARAAMALAVDWVAAHGELAAVAVERPGGGARADYGPRSQAEAAEGPAWVGGLVAMGIALELGLDDPLRFRSWEWRQTMLARAAQECLRLAPPMKGLAAPRPRAPMAAGSAGGSLGVENPWDGARRVARPPKVERVGAAFVLIYACGHRLERPNYEAVSATLRDVGCPVCREPKVVQPKETLPGGGKERTDQWKEQAWFFFHHARPDLAARLLADARGRAREEREPWRHVGVADACEAVGVAVHGLCVLKSS